MLKHRSLRYTLILAVTVVVCLPLVGQVVRKSANRSADESRTAAAAEDGNTNPVPEPLAPPATRPTSRPTSVDPARIVLKVGDEKITAGEFEGFVADLPPQRAAQVLARPDGRRRLAEQIVMLKVVADEAQRRMAEAAPRDRLTYQQALMQAMTNLLAADTVEDQKFFNSHRTYFDKLKARHILIATDDSVVPGKKLSDDEARTKAQLLKKRLDQGEDFAKLAKAESDDVRSGAEGGDLGSVYRGMMVPPFEQALFALKKGEISEPVRTPFGYHIIQLLDKETSTYDQAREKVVQKRFETLLEDLKARQPADLDEVYFGKAPVAPTTQPTTQPATKPASTQAIAPTPSVAK